MSKNEDDEYLHRQLIHLGDMMGDGLHLEPDGKWISREYKKILKTLGYIKSKPRNSNKINGAMVKRTSEVSCGNCGGIDCE